jgi:hypothetical protein
MISLLFALTLMAADDPIRLDVARDTWLSGVGSEVDGSNGAASKLKVKSHQELSLIDVDVPAGKFNGRVIQSAALHVRSTGEPRLKRVTVGGLASKFIEGTATNYEPQKGSSTFRNFEHPDAPWAGIGDVANVLFGPRGDLWKTADATPPDKDGWQTIAVDPRVMAARFAGLSGGFVVFDDTGTEWTRDGEKYTRTMFPNRFVYSRDQNRASAPYFTIVMGEKDAQPPGPVTDLRVDRETLDLPEGEAFVSWMTPKDVGPAGVLGFRATLDRVPANLKLIPMADKPGDCVRIHLTRAAGVLFAIQAIDAAGNASEPRSVKIEASNRFARLPFRDGQPVSLGIQALKLGTVTISVIDELDRVEPVKGTILPGKGLDESLLINHIFDASVPRIDLRAARGEAVAFQVVVTGTVEALTVSLELKNPASAEVSIGRYVNVMTKDGPMPDPIVPLTGPINVPVPGVNSTSLHVELQVSKEARVGPNEGKLILKSKSDRLEIPFELVVSNFVLPDHLSFLPEMNCYGLPENERDYYRLAHKHRTVLNRVPYGQNGLVQDGCAPKWDGKALDWTAWDKRFGPLFDGSAFADLPRKTVPIELFYLPLQENWPTSIEGNYNGDYWADRAFTPKHRDAFIAASKQFATHIRAKQWNDTFFECFFNGKNDFKDRGWSRGSSPWLLDEPANFQDFWALRYFGGLFHQGINAAPAGKAKLVFRADISRPQWQRDLFDDVLDINIVGSAVRDYQELLMESKARLGQVVIEYGSSNAIGSSNIQPVAWSIDAWTLGLDGVLPWQTVGTDESWKTADELSLFYPGKNGGPPVPSIRLKAYRRGQQDVEYLTLLGKVNNEPNWSVARRVRATLKTAGVRQGTGGNAIEDAGRIDYGNLSTASLAALRKAVSDEINNHSPMDKPAGGLRLIELRTPRREPKPLQDRVVR